MIKERLTPWFTLGFTANFHAKTEKEKAGEMKVRKTVGYLTWEFCNFSKIEIFFIEIEKGIC